MAKVAWDEWEVIERILPARWESKAKETGTLRRCRGFANAGQLLRVMMIHLVDGCSLRETAVRAAEGNLAQVSDVALLKALRRCQEWFRWMAQGLMQQWLTALVAGAGARRIRVVDGSMISEPGSTGSNWRLHYSATLPSLHCDEVIVTGPEVGESFSRYTVQPGDLLIGDRGLAHRKGIRHVLNSGGDVLVRLNLTNVPLVDDKGQRFGLLTHLRRLHGTQVGDWPVVLVDEHGQVRGRVCAIKKSRAAAARARKRAQQENSRKGHLVQDSTLEAAGYIFVFTTLNAEQYPAARVLELYRGRWQVELAFKRLKSILATGHLKKTDPIGAKAWLQGKLLAAVIIEALINMGERFSPWGYPLPEFASALPVARDLADEIPA
jgi:Transposase DDE domain